MEISFQYALEVASTKSLAWLEQARLVIRNHKAPVPPGAESALIVIVCAVEEELRRRSAAKRLPEPPVLPDTVAIDRAVTTFFQAVLAKQAENAYAAAAAYVSEADGSRPTAGLRAGERKTA